MDYGQVQRKLEMFLQSKLEEADADGYVLGVSGGLDSAVTLKTAVEAVGSGRVNAWIMPGAPSREENMEDARELCQKLGVETREVDIEPVVAGFRESLDFSPGKNAAGNLRARVRMVYEYLDANQNQMLVLGSGNRTEYLLGYFTKYGDAAVDVRLLQGLYKTQVKRLAQCIGLDSRFIDKKPTPGLWKGQSDEDELGAGYEVIDIVLEHLFDRKLSAAETARKTGVPQEKVQRLRRMYQSSRHKREPVPAPELR